MALGIALWVYFLPPVVDTLTFVCRAHPGFEGTSSLGFWLSVIQVNDTDDNDDVFDDDDDDDDNDDDKHIGHSPGIWFSSPHQNQKRAQ